MSATVQFAVKYDGPALAEHQMDVRELAPALLALSSLLEESNKALNGKGPEVRVNVRGNFQAGSFEVALEAALSMKDQIVSILSGDDATALGNLLSVLTGLGLLGGGGLISLIRWLGGRKPSKIEYRGEKVFFSVEDSETIETMELDLSVGRLYSTRTVRQSLSKVLKPLTQNGIDCFAAGQDGKAEVVITKADVTAFYDLGDDAEIVSNSLLERSLLQIESAVFKDGNKWRFSDGATSFFAEISDEQFVQRVESGEERFGKNDVLVVDLRKVQSIADTGLKSDYRIEKVWEHKEPLQSSMFRST
jgi:hypothetical protein